MSIKVMNLVWESAPYEGNTLLTLLAIADRADDEGVCWPSVATLATKTRQSERNTQRCLKQVAKDGFLEREFRKDNSTVYRIVIAKLRGDKLSPGDKRGIHGVTNDAQNVSQMSPSTSLNHQEEYIKAVVWLASRYREIFGFDETTWTLTDARKKKALTRLEECLKKTNTLNGAIGMMLLAVKTCRASRFHMGENDRATKFISWEKNIFHSQEQLEDWITKGTKQRTVTNPQNDPMQLMRQQRGIVDVKA